MTTVTETDYTKEATIKAIKKFEETPEFKRLAEIPVDYWIAVKWHSLMKLFQFALTMAVAILILPSIFTNGKGLFVWVMGCIVWEFCDIMTGLGIPDDNLVIQGIKNLNGTVKSPDREQFIIQFLNNFKHTMYQNRLSVILENSTSVIFAQFINLVYNGAWAFLLIFSVIFNKVVTDNSFVGNAIIGGSIIILMSLSMVDMLITFYAVNDLQVSNDTFLPIREAKLAYDRAIGSVSETRVMNRPKPNTEMVKLDETSKSTKNWSDAEVNHLSRELLNDLAFFHIKQLADDLAFIKKVTNRPGTVKATLRSQLGDQLYQIKTLVISWKTERFIEEAYVQTHHGHPVTKTVLLEQLNRTCTLIHQEILSYLKEEQEGFKTTLRTFANQLEVEEAHND